LRSSTQPIGNRLASTGGFEIGRRLDGFGSGRNLRPGP